MKAHFLMTVSLYVCCSLYSQSINQNNNQSMKNSEDSVSVKYEVLIEAQIKDVFPLTCPVMEYKWTNGWKCELIHCPNGYVELGCVFKEIMTAPILMGNACGKTTWTCIKNDTINFQRYYELKNKISTTLWKIEMFPQENSSTKVTIENIYKANTKKAEKLIKNNLPKKLYFMLSLLGTELKYYCENGTMIPDSEVMKFVKNADSFSGSDKFRLVLNKLAMTIQRDRDQKRFLAGKPVSKINH